MDKKVYFTKVEFREYIGYRLNSILVLDLAEGTLVYQVYERSWKKKAPAITGSGTEEFLGHTWDYEIRKPAVKMRNAKTGFKSVIIEDDVAEYDVVFTHSHKFSEDEKKEVLQYCNALEFEPYRDRKMSMEDEGYCGYRDEVDLYFTGITDSYIPMIELPMDYYYDEKHIWPSEKLYRYIVRTFLTSKKLRKWVISYGGLSLRF